MKKVWQRIDDPKRGDCLKCTVCALLDLEYDDVPNFVEHGDDWWTMLCDTFREHGYKVGDLYLYNPNILYIENPTGCCFEKNYVYEDYTLSALKKEHGINGLFLASVYSPKYTSPSEHPVAHLHSVLCDINYNIVFDPQRNYENILSYPFANIIGYNGIRGVDAIEKL